MMRGLMALVVIGAGLTATSSLAAGKIAPPGRQVDVKTPLYEFEYSYPAAAGRIPALKAWLDKDAAQKQADIASGAREASADAKKERNGYFSAYDSDTDWQVVTELPGWLSLSGMAGAYTGGAHPNHIPVALLWDKTHDRQVAASDLFTSKAALTAAIRKPFCAELNKQRADKRGEDIDPKSKDEFDACIDPVGEAVILGSADHARFTRIGILIGPYEAGPYSEGDYEVTLPVTPQVLAAVRPEYRAAFALGR